MKAKGSWPKVYSSLGSDLRQMWCRKLANCSVFFSKILTLESGRYDSSSYGNVLLGSQNVNGRVCTKLRFERRWQLSHGSNNWECTVNGYVQYPCTCPTGRSAIAGDTDPCRFATLYATYRFPCETPPARLGGRMRLCNGLGLLAKRGSNTLPWFRLENWYDGMALFNRKHGANVSKYCIPRSEYQRPKEQWPQTRLWCFVRVLR